jgi:hypothetical protein
MAKNSNISNGTTAEIAFCEAAGDYVMHHFDHNSIRSMGRYKTMEGAVDRLHKLASMWGGYEVTEA